MAPPATPALRKTQTASYVQFGADACPSSSGLSTGAVVLGGSAGFALGAVLGSFLGLPITMGLAVFGISYGTYRKIFKS